MKGGALVAIQLEHSECKEKFTEVGRPDLSFMLIGVSAIDNLSGILRVAESVSARNVYLDQLSSNTYRARKSHIERKTRSKNIDAQSCAEIESVLQNYIGRAICVEVTRYSCSVFESNYPQGELLLIAGSERNGIPENILKYCPFHVHVPMYGLNSSMNVAAALAICSHAIAYQQCRSNQGR